MIGSFVREKRKRLSSNTYTGKMVTERGAVDLQANDHGNQQTLRRHKKGFSLGLSEEEWP